MTNKILASLLFIISINLHAQNAPLGSLYNAPNRDLLNQYGTLKGKFLIRNDYTEYSEIDGSPYLYDSNEFIPGKVFFPDGKSTQALLRYEVPKEQIHVLIDNKNYQVLNQEVKIELKNDFFYKFRYVDEEGNHLLGYFKIYNLNSESKNVILLEKPLKEVRGSARNKARGFPPKFVDKSNYYLKFRNDLEAKYVDSKPKNFLELFPTKDHSEIQKFMDNNNLKPKKEEDLKEILSYYNKNFNLENTELKTKIID